MNAGRHLVAFVTSFVSSVLSASLLSVYAANGEFPLRPEEKKSPRASYWTASLEIRTLIPGRGPRVSPVYKDLHAATQQPVKEKRLLAIVRDKEAQERDRERYVQAIERLGEIRSITAVDDLIELITFKRTLRSEENPWPIVIDREHPVTPLSLYPAAGALFYIGKPALPALRRLIETSDPDSLASQNAIYTLMAIFREDPKAGVRYLQDAANQAQTPEASNNFLRAVERARNLFRIE
jgi:HEAT repeat protein